MIFEITFASSHGFISISRNAFQMGTSERMTADGPIVLVVGLILIGIGVARLTNTAIPRFVQRSPRSGSGSCWATTTTRYTNGRHLLIARARSAQ